MNSCVIKNYVHIIITRTFSLNWCYLIFIIYQDVYKYNVNFCKILSKYNEFFISQTTLQERLWMNFYLAMICFVKYCSNLMLSGLAIKTFLQLTLIKGYSLPSNKSLNIILKVLHNVLIQLVTET